MAPTKDKARKLVADEDSARILDYLRKQNRPYSASDIISNLSTTYKITKASAAKHLKILHERKEIQERAAGKQLVYHAVQAAVEESVQHNTEIDLSRLDEQITSLRISLKQLRSNEKDLKVEFVSRSSARSLIELQDAVGALTMQKEGLTQRIAELKSLQEENKMIRPVAVSEDERRKVDTDLAKWTTETKIRRLAVKNLWKLIKDLPQAEAFSGLNECDFWDVLGCEGSPPR